MVLIQILLTIEKTIFMATYCQLSIFNFPYGKQQINSHIQN